MTASGSMERALTEWLAEEAAGGPAEHVVDDLFAATRRTRQAPAWLARVQEPAMRWHRAPAAGTSRRRLALVTAGLLLLLAAFAAVVGGRPRETALSGDWLGYRGGSGRDSVGLVGPTGRPVLRWEFVAGAAVKDQIAVVGDLAIIPSQDGVLHGVAVTDGQERWAFRPGTSISGPTVDGTTVLAVDGRGVVHGLALASGFELWQSSEVVTSASGIATGDGGVYIATADGDVVALDLATGQLRWRVALGTAAVHAPAYADGSIFVATDDGLFVALRASDGSRIWTVPVGSDLTGTPTVAGGIAYVGVPGEDVLGRLRAVNASTGAPIWTVDDVLFAPAVSGSLAVSGGRGGVVSARDAATGIQRWAFQSRGMTRGPAIVGGVVYVESNVGREVDALDASTGHLLWSFQVNADDQCCIAVAKGLVFVGSMSGSVFAIGGDGSTRSPDESPPSVTAALASHPGNPPTQTPAPSATPAPLPDPFTTVSRYGAADLGLQRPLGLAIGPSGDVYVTDLSDRVTQIDRTGTVVRRWGGHGSGPGQFDFVPAQSSENVHGSIGVGPDGKVYVSDSDNHRIQVFSANGHFLRQFGTLGSAPGQFTIPFDVSADASGNIYAIDDGLLRITKVSPAGKVVWIVDGTSDPLLAGHSHDADIDPDGRIIVLNDNLGVVVALDADGTVRDHFDAPGCDVTIDLAGRLYVTGCGGGITVYGADQRAIAQGSADGALAPQFGPDGEVVALTDDGSVLFLSVSLPPH